MWGWLTRKSPAVTKTCFYLIPAGNQITWSTQCEWACTGVCFQRELKGWREKLQAVFWTLTSAPSINLMQRQPNVNITNQMHSLLYLLTSMHKTHTDDRLTEIVMSQKAHCQTASDHITPLADSFQSNNIVEVLILPRDVSVWLRGDKHILAMYATPRWQVIAVVDSSCWQRCFATQSWLLLYY